MGKKSNCNEPGSVEHDLLKHDCSIGRILKERGVSRRDFLKFCSAMTAAMSLPASFAPRVAQALDEVKRPTLVWLEMQSCTGDTEALLRSANPTVAEIVLDILSVDYHETIMAAAGHQAEGALDKTIADFKGKYICVIEGSISMKDGGIYGTTGGKTHLERARQVCGGALATIAVDSEWPSVRESATTGLKERRIDDFLTAYYGQRPDVLKKRQACFAGPAGAAAEWLDGYIQEGARYLVLRFAGDHERHLEIIAKLREALAP